ncbi:MAG TPA: hypothetical protein VGS60_07915 [Actinomycetes bacterium]|jgi:hypothetical protein|nr:hypothetical protein [Actinomycetes bacterium]
MCCGKGAACNGGIADRIAREIAGAVAEAFTKAPRLTLPAGMRNAGEFFRSYVEGELADPAAVARRAMVSVLGSPRERYEASIMATLRREWREERAQQEAELECALVAGAADDILTCRYGRD